MNEIKDLKNLKVGDTIWFANCGSQQVEVTCPVCFGQKQVTVILGNGEHILTPCEMCQLGYLSSRGFITEYKWLCDPKIATVSEVRVNETLSGREVEYLTESFNSRNLLKIEDIFNSKEEAEIRCQEKIKEFEAEQKKKLEWSKEKAHKSYSYHVGYHRNQAKGHKRQMEWHEARAINCKARAKTEVKENI